MRLPTEAQLSGEQREIIFAPAEGTNLVVGPPGSGKTVVALYRAKSLERKGERCSLIMYNKVLKKYTNVRCQTGLRWIGDWWRGAIGSAIPSTKSQVETRYGPRWQTHWDYAEAIAIISQEPELFRRKGHWGHLILDEAQDFPPDAHRLLFCVQNLVFGELQEDKRPSLLVLADENQRLSTENSTIRDLESSYMLEARCIYGLRRNYRNTREVARFASHFFVGLRSGIPEVPDARGELPVVGHTRDVNDAVDRIARFARAHENHEIGVFVYYDNTRKQLFNKLLHRFKGSAVSIQTYGSKDRDHNNAERLEFSRPGTVTVLCFASGKGLEFDAVFLPELQSFPVDAEHTDLARMNLYVMCSRARSHLFLFASNDSGERAKIWSLLPSDKSIRREA